MICGFFLSNFPCFCGFCVFFCGGGGVLALLLLRGIRLGTIPREGPIPGLILLLEGGLPK